MIYFDTLKTANELTTAGMDAHQAKTLINIFKVLLENQHSQQATKQDLELVASQCKTEIHEVKSEIKAIKWMLGVFGTIVMVAIVQHNFVH